jgi:hypothetical protein
VYESYFRFFFVFGIRSDRQNRQSKSTISITNIHTTIWPSSSLSLVHYPESRVLPDHAMMVLVDQFVRQRVRVEAAERAPVFVFVFGYLSCFVVGGGVGDFFLDEWWGLPRHNGCVGCIETPSIPPQHFIRNVLLDELHPVRLREAEDAHPLARVAEGDDDGHGLCRW